MRVLTDYSLKPYNTFGIDVTARCFTEIASLIDIPWLVSLPEFKELPHLMIGEGSNVLFTRNYEGLVILNRIKGFSTQQVDENIVRVTAGAGVKWHDLVVFTLDNGLGGIENLSLIPGTVGAAPIQNIGAYGVELKDVFYCLKAYEVASGEMKTFYTDDCRFGYRNSIFKQEFKNKFIITEVTLNLATRPQVRTSYGAIKTVLLERGIQEPTIKDVSEAVIHIRQSKLPDPAKIGNSGSFFKNPVLSKVEFDLLKESFSDIPGYENGDNEVKVPAAWLIDQCGWKGHRRGNIGVHEFQPLVLVNYGGGSGQAIKELSLEVQESVFEKFGIKLTPEVNII